MAAHAKERESLCHSCHSLAWPGIYYEKMILELRRKTVVLVDVDMKRMIQNWNAAYLCFSKMLIIGLRNFYVVPKLRFKHGGDKDINI